MVISTKEEWINAKHLEDYRETNGAIVQDFSGRTYLHTYIITSKKQLQAVVSDEKHKEELQADKDKMKIAHMTCRFLIKSSKLTIEEQYQIIDFQDGFYDDITIQLFTGNLEDFKKCMVYAAKKKKPLNVVLDLKENLRLVQQAHEVLKKYSIAYIKYIYGKIYPPHIKKYAEATAFCKEQGIKKVLINCNKRCGIDGHRHMSVAMLAIIRLGFNATCHRDGDSPRKNTRGFKPRADYFDAESWEFVNSDFEEYPHEIPAEIEKKHRAVRLHNLAAISEELKKDSAQKVRNIVLFQSLSRLLADQGL